MYWLTLVGVSTFLLNDSLLYFLSHQLFQEKIVRQVVLICTLLKSAWYGLMLWVIRDANFNYRPIIDITKININHNSCNCDRTSMWGGIWYDGHTNGKHIHWAHLYVCVTGITTQNLISQAHSTVSVLKLSLI